MANDAIDYLASRSYRWGDLQAIHYQRERIDVFKPIPYLVHLYNLTRSSGRSHLGSLPMLFCGMLDLSCEGIVGYLHQRPVIVVGKWTSKNDFRALGYCFPSVPVLQSRSSTKDNPKNSMFAGYTFFEEAWKTPEQTVLMYLGLAYLFGEFHLAAIHGVRYRENVLTARFCRKFGFRDLGTIPYYMVRESDGELVEGVASTLDRKDFESRLRVILGNVEDASG